MAPVVVVLVDGMLLRHLDDFVRLLECQGGFNVQRVCDVQLDQPQLLRLRTVSVASNGPPPLVLPPLCDLVRAVVLLLELDDSAYVTFERVARVLGQPLYGSADATQATIDVDVFLPLSAVNDLTLISGHLPNSYGSLHDTAGVVAPAPLLQLASLRSSPDATSTRDEIAQRCPSFNDFLGELQRLRREHPAIKLDADCLYSSFKSFCSTKRRTGRR